MPFAARAAEADSPTAADMADDIEILRQALELHPGLYRYASPRETEARVNRLARDWSGAPTLEARYLHLSRFLGTILCGHSYANFSNQRRAVAKALFDRPTRLPFRFVWVGGAMVVADDLQPALPRGTVIERIERLSPLAMRNALLPYARADGRNDAKRVSLLEVRGGDSIEYFDVFQGLLFPPPNGVFRLEARLPDGDRKKVELPALDLAGRRAQRIAAPVPADGVEWNWTLRRDGVAVLRMPTWGLYNSKWDWRAWLEARLDSLGGARGLILDIRTNEGGLDCGDPILARLIDRPFTPPGYEQRLRFERTPKALDPHLDTWDNSFRTLGVGGKDLGTGFRLRPGGSAAVTIAPAASKLALPIAALVSPVNSSATFQFAQAARATGRIKLYGQPTGGNRRGINGGCFFFVRLPASGLEFDLPLVGYFARTPQPDAGVLPDVDVRATAADIAAGGDVVIERAASDLLRA